MKKLLIYLKACRILKLSEKANSWHFRVLRKNKRKVYKNSKRDGSRFIKNFSLQKNFKYRTTVIKASSFDKNHPVLT